MCHWNPKRLQPTRTGPALKCGVMKYLEYPELEVLSRALTFEMSECKVFTRIEAYSCKAVNKEKRLFKSLESSYLLSASSSPPAYLEEALASPFGRLDQPSARKTLFLLIATLNGAFPDHDFSEVNPADFVRESSPTVVLNSLTSTLLSLRSGTGSPASLHASIDDSPLLSSLARSPLALDARSTPSHVRAATPTAADGVSSGTAATHTPGPASGSGASPNLSSSRSAFASLPSVIDEIIHTADCEVYTFHPDMDSDPHASAEPDEEGTGDMYETDPYDEGYTVDDDDQMAGTNAAHSGGMHGNGAGDAYMDDASMADTPMFDEDMDVAPSLLGSAHGGAHASPSLTVDEDDLAGAGAGLLWSTFAFFYNKRMKRILFVSVWSRKNSPLGTTPTMWSSPSLGAVQPLTATDDVPALGIAPSLYDRLAERATAAPSAPRPTRARRSAPYSVAQRRTRQTTRGRSASNSPAPSALSPFPHAQAPHAMHPPAARQASSTCTSLDAAALSVSAPDPRAVQPLAANPPSNGI